MSEEPFYNQDNSHLYLSAQKRRIISTCNLNYSKEGIYHPDRILPEYDLLYMMHGEWDVWEEDTCYHLNNHSVLLLEPGKHHFSIEKCSPEMRNLYIHFGALPEDRALTLEYTREFPEAASGDGICIAKLTDCSNNRNVIHYFEEIIETYWSDRTANKELRLGALLELLLIELAGISEPGRQAADVLVTEIIHRFYTSPERFFSPEELAFDYSVGLRTLSTRFKKETGQSIHQYQLRLKLDMAYDLLPLNPGRSLRDIALGFGFYDEFQFSKLFKRQFGISPSKRRG